mgnify:CR=1 FL=1
MNLLEGYQVQQMCKAAELRNGRKIKLRWNTPTEVRRSLAKVNNLLLNNEIPAKSANAVYYSANLILHAIELEQNRK